jgi:hypothetical protein
VYRRMKRVPYTYERLVNKLESRSSAKITWAIKAYRYTGGDEGIRLHIHTSTRCRRAIRDLPVAIYFKDGGIRFPWAGSPRVGLSGKQWFVKYVNSVLPENWCISLLEIPKTGRSWEVISTPYAQPLTPHTHYGIVGTGLDIYELIPAARERAQMIVSDFLSGKLHVVADCAQEMYDLRNATTNCAFLPSRLDARDTWAHATHQMRKGIMENPAYHSAILSWGMESFSAGSFWGNLINLYWKDQYPKTGKPKTLKQASVNLESMMKTDVFVQRPAGNSSQFHQLKNLLTSLLLNRLLKTFGFNSNP